MNYKTDALGFASVSLATFGYNVTRQFTLIKGDTSKLIPPVVQKYLLNIFDTYFSGIDELELINDITNKNIAFKERVGFWAAFVKAVCENGKSESVIDVTNDWCYPIAESDLEKYPKESTDTDNHTTFTVYKCKKYFRVHYKKLPKTYLDELVDPKDWDNITPAINSVTFKLYNKLASNLEGFDITKQPFKVNIFNADNFLEKTLIFNSARKFSQGISTGLKNGDYTFEVESDGIMLITESGDVTSSGSFKIENNQTVIFNFKYTAGILKATFTLSPDITTSVKIDLDSYPVIITLTSSSHKFELIFNNASKKNSGEFEIETLVNIGNYTVTISSKQLKFDNIENVNITAESHSVVFMYSIEDATVEKYLVYSTGKKSDFQFGASFNILIANPTRKYTLDDVYVTTRDDYNELLILDVVYVGTYTQNGITYLAYNANFTVSKIVTVYLTYKPVQSSSTLFKYQADNVLIGTVTER